MRKSLFLLAFFVSALTLPLTAHADSMDDFTIVGGGHTITYSLDSSITFPNFSLFNFFTASAPTTIDGTSGYVETGDYYDTGIFPHVSLILSVPDAVFGATQIYLLGPPFIDFDFVSPTTGIATFVTGMYTLQGLSSFGLQPLDPPVTYTLTISPETSAPTPEPSSLILLTTGALGLIRFAGIRGRRQPRLR